MKWFRQCDRRVPFLWEGPGQPPARWHGDGEGPVQYLANTPEAAWAEFLRHEEITDPADLVGISRAVWVVDDGEESLSAHAPSLPADTLTGGIETYPACRSEARDLRGKGATALLSPSAALKDGTSGGYRVESGLREEPVDAQVLALFGPRPNIVGLPVVRDGRPGEEVLGRVRALTQRGDLPK